MPYTITPDQLKSITDAEMAFGTERLLPSMNDIPKDFTGSNVYTRLASMLFYSDPLPSDWEIEFKTAFDNSECVRWLDRCVKAHLMSRGPKHEHKIAGVAFLISMVCEVREPKEPEGAEA